MIICRAVHEIETPLQCYMMSVMLGLLFIACQIRVYGDLITSL